MKTEHGPSIAQLSAKFFGTEEVADSGRKAGNVFAPVDKTIKTVQIAPKKGGPAKTADIDTKSGKISIVQG
ncbi:hypothetical protein BWQ93_03250 [Sphingopyxis sp. QXT-31]|nr:hypothetical protein BWQ93_03250 [Sphingopyxis sp. QXT-31]